MKLESNHPKLTAYALGELEETEAAAIELQLSQDAALNDEIDQIREIAALLTEELAQEPFASLPPATGVGVTASAGSSRHRLWLPVSIAASILGGLLVIHFTGPAPIRDSRHVVTPSGAIAKTPLEATDLQPPEQTIAESAVTSGKIGVIVDKMSTDELLFSAQSDPLGPEDRSRDGITEIREHEIIAELSAGDSDHPSVTVEFEHEVGGLPAISKSSTGGTFFTDAVSAPFQHSLQISVVDESAIFGNGAVADSANGSLTVDSNAFYLNDSITAGDRFSVKLAGTIAFNNSSAELKPATGTNTLLDDINGETFTDIPRNLTPAEAGAEIPYDGGFNSRHGGFKSRDGGFNSRGVVRGRIVDNYAADLASKGIGGIHAQAEKSSGGVQTDDASAPSKNSPRSAPEDAVTLITSNNDVTFDSAPSVLTESSTHSGVVVNGLFEEVSGTVRTSKNIEEITLTAGTGIGQTSDVEDELKNRIDENPVQLAKATIIRRKEISNESESSSYVKVIPPPAPSPSGENYEPIHENPFLRTLEHPLSTFSVDVDTASYTNIRRFLNQGQFPPPAAVRIEEMVNFFDYDYAGPKDESPFAAHAEIAECPWRKQNRLALIGLKGKELQPKERPAANLVFLLDVSGSMSDSMKLPLLKACMRMLVEKLRVTDRVALVTYASNAGIALGSTPCEYRETILAHIDNLRADGSTNGGSGIKLAYEQARQHFIKGGINRIILASDGDFNVGITDKNELVRLISAEARSGVFLSVLGFGTGNLKDDNLEQLANRGNGNYAYIDSLTEGYRILVEQMSSLMTIAKDVKIQIEFNPAKVAAYRLIGYENRTLAKQDFNNDAKDAGEIGAGHTVTALYELVPAGQEIPEPLVDKLKYQKEASLAPAADTTETLTLKLRYNLPNETGSRRVEYGITDGGNSYANASSDLKFASSVAAFGLILRGSRFRGNATLEGIQELAGEARGEDKSGKRTEFLDLVGKAQRITGK